jgi:hypothetical protein
MNSSKPLKHNNPLLLTVLWILIGCAQPAPIQDPPQQQPSEMPGELDVGSTLAVYPGPLDLKNR